MERSQYESKARKYAHEVLDITVKASFKGQKCPSWDDERHIHGDQYRVTIARRYGFRWPRSVTFDFWNSQADSESGKRPGYYDILACVASDVNGPTDPDEVVEEFGPMKPSQAIAAADFARRLQVFFTPKQIDDLSRLEEVISA